MTEPEIYMHRCLQLARMRAGYTAPNPMVGAILVHEGKIIGEGYHEYYGKAHAEVNCIQSVKPENLGKLTGSTIYVSLEPCAHFGKTPPCADLIISNKIPRVVIGCRDPYKEVDGRGIEKLSNAGIQVELGILEKECTDLNKRFFTYTQKKRPFVLLKWAQTFDGFIGKMNSRQIISNDLTNRLTHKWRSEEAAIMVGTNTALLDDPALTVRHWNGHQPVRILIDMNLRLPSTLKIFESPGRIIIFNSKKEKSEGGIEFIKLDPSLHLIPQLMHALHELKIQSVMVEGGAKLLQAFFQEGIWDEARVIVNKNMILGEGISAPGIRQAKLIKEETIDPDIIHYFLPA
jgi:diaminohydroxyphosphoribosylaminopyrimidine deaminase/5-amino-6-(5-phosphoribosylamino)uracil reductase